MKTASQAVLAFQTAVVAYQSIGTIQKVLLKAAVTNNNQALAATRLLALMGDADIFPLLYRAAERVTMVDVTAAGVAALQDILDALAPYADTLRLALGEAATFLPPPTSDVLRDYAQPGYPFEQLAGAVFIILAATLQD